MRLEQIELQINNQPRIESTSVVIEYLRDNTIIWAESGRDPDETWCDIDSKGHFHAYSLSDISGYRGDPYPTLRKVVTHKDCNGSCGARSPLDDCDGWNEEHYVCRICEVRVSPATKASSGKVVPGDTTVVLTIDSLSTPLAINEQVTVRIGHSSGQRFGIARVTDIEGHLMAGGAIYKAKLAIVGQLGVRHGVRFTKGDRA